MTTLDQEPDRPQGYMEGRLEEQSVALQDLKTGQQELSRRIDVVHQELSRRLDTVHQELNHRIDAGLQEVRTGQRQIFVTQWIIGGGVVASLIGGLFVLLTRAI